MEQALREAIEKAGGVSKLAGQLKITSQAVSQWKRAPAERVPEISRLSGVPKHELRPDLWSKDEAA